MALHRHVGDADEQLTPNPLLSGSDAPHVLPRLRIPEATTPPEIAARLVRGDLILDGNARLERGCDAGRDGAAVALAGAPARGGQAGRERAGRRRLAARRRRLRRLRGTVHPARPRMGLPAAAGAVDQCVGPQVRARLPRDGPGAVARRRGAARGGYHVVHEGCRDIARRLSAGIAALGPFELLTDGSEPPVFAFKLRAEVTNYTVFEVSRALRERGGATADLAAARVPSLISARAGGDRT